MGITKKIVKLKEKSSEIKKEIFRKSLGYVVAAFGFVIALAWNDFIKSAIDRYFPMPADGLKAKLLYAIIITAVLVIISVYLVKLFEDDEEKKK
ncbi:MAG: DUF5654 family protein [Patescibacteria group bacterium]|nr:DUF5654 family protein [Patescibacteria group bacterium]